MDPSNKPKRRALPANYIFITAADVLRWWQKRDALKKQAAAELSAQSIRDMFVALMAWEDDGGADDSAQPQ